MSTCIYLLVSSVTYETFLTRTERKGFEQTCRMKHFRVVIRFSGLGWLSWYSDSHTGWTVLGSNPGGGRFFSPPSGPSMGPTQPPVRWAPGFFPGGKAALGFHGLF